MKRSLTLIALLFALAIPSVGQEVAQAYGSSGLGLEPAMATIATDSLSPSPMDSMTHLQADLPSPPSIAPADSLPLVYPPFEPTPQVSEPWHPNSRTAMLWAILPGGGQIYNQKYWKLPIVWGAFTSCVYAIRWNQRMFRDYHAAYRALSSEDPTQDLAWLSFTPKGTNPEDWKQFSSLKDALRRGDEYFHRYRDISIVVGVAVYALSILDAYVDAELSTFDISPDLSMRIYPTVGSEALNARAMQVGLGCSLQF